MNKLKVSLKNCYGIQSLDYDFDFDPSKIMAKAYAIYAPNGSMKTSFSKTFEDLAKGGKPIEERYGRASIYVIESDGKAIQQDVIYVLKSEIDIREDSSAITDILINPESKARYDELLVGLDKLKASLTRSLQKLSKVKQADVEQTILKDWGEKDLATCITQMRKTSIEDDLSSYEYAPIFDAKVMEVLKSHDFISKANEFSDRYQELFEQAGTIYQKGIFNPVKAEASFGTLLKQGFFTVGHRVHLRGDAGSIDKAELDKKIQAIHAKIDGDETLKSLRTSLAKNVQTQALVELLENLSSTQIELLLGKLKPENQPQFRKDLWASYIQNNTDASAYVESYMSNKNEIESIEAVAAQDAPRWTIAVGLFNDRFVDMPFRLSVANQVQAALGKEKAKLKFTFKDGADTVEWSRQEVKTLSQGEKRALYLLNFIFDVEARKAASQDTLFIIDDVADSFDYKNKHAIVQYLEDLSKTQNFHQIILTHNFDFFRTLAYNFVHRERCIMANRNGSSIVLAKAEGINNYFIGKWKDKVAADNFILCATIPFTRNLIEYTKGVKDADYLILTSLLHWKSDTGNISVGNYLDIYNRLFGTSHDTNNTLPAIDLLCSNADDICKCEEHDGLNLENKVLLSIAIRMQAEIFLTNEIRKLKNDESYWSESKNQFGDLMREYSDLSTMAPAMRILEKVSITVSTNIHLNSFMYEPILDLTIDHLIILYKEVHNLNI
ncbi:AAA family ATPase [Pseudomonas sp. TH03]|uniref:AAA family ATPase n=1 Tax=Pseudomonas sp. TH03 TaxID=2796369 RepID=UPI001912AD8B|nr:AAA family ATPase [Pseudomonas sp. TH03]MBK5549340.1 AAA family ATPase [Pseudomonas sp. TH03]